jgi:TetR/AcrR family transcriptional repressor of mexJK operon
MSGVRGAADRTQAGGRQGREHPRGGRAQLSRRRFRRRQHGRDRHFANKEELFGAIVGRVCEQRFETFSAQELDPADMRRSLTILGRRFLDLLLSPEAIAVHRIIVGEVIRFPLLGEVFWRAGPERTLGQIEAFMRRGSACGALVLADPRRAAEQFVGMVRGETHLRHLLRLETTTAAADVGAAVDGAVDTFLRAFQPAP